MGGDAASRSGSVDVRRDRGTRRRTVTVFDVDLPPGIAFVRSLGRAGVPVVACSSRRFPAGGLSRHVSGRRSSPSVHHSDQFISWLVDEVASGGIDLIAPTSDFVSFCVAEALEQLGPNPPDVGHPSPDALRTCLFKARFFEALDAIGFPSPPTAVPSSVGEALADAERIGYPVVLKPRSHVGIGTHRGLVVRTAGELEVAFEPFELGDAHDSALRHVPDLAVPLLQRYCERGTVECISVSGFLGRDGQLVALNHSRKVSQWPRRFGVGTVFEPVPSQPFTTAAVDAVRSILGSGLFELEVLVDRRTGEYGAIDLNPRAFGQVALDIALGNDLPCIWYEAVTGSELGARPPSGRPPEFWQDALSVHVETTLNLIRGPHRRAVARDAIRRVRAPKVDAAMDRWDPLPGVIFGMARLRHPRAFVRQFLVDTEVASSSSGQPS